MLPLLILVFGCTHKTEKLTEDKLQAHAAELAQKFIITDGHIDFPDRLGDLKVPIEKSGDKALADPEGDFDYERAKRGGLDAPFMSIYIASAYQKTKDYGKGHADTLIARVNAIVAAHPDKFAFGNSPKEIEKNFEEGKISLPMGMENGAPLGMDVSNLKYFFDKGIRYITLTHGADNQFCDSSYDSAHTHGGLSKLGVALVKEMNRMGMMIDISHVDDSTFYQVMRLSKKPCIASHSSCRHFTPDFVRNMSDDMIKLLAKNGGVIQINFGSGFLDSAARSQGDKDKKALAKLIADSKFENDEAKENFIKQFKKEHPYRFSDAAKVADHIDRAVKLTSIDNVGLGSDYDGVGDSLPEGLKDVSGYPNLIYELLKRGYSDEDIEKICSKNVFRVWNEVLKGE